MKAPINLDNSHLKDYSLSLVEADWLNNLKKETFTRFKTQNIPSKRTMNGDIQIQSHLFKSVLSWLLKKVLAI